MNTEEQPDKMIMHPLPTWLAENMPEPNPVHMVHYNDLTKKFWIENDQEGRYYDTLVDLYDSHREENPDYDIDFAPDALRAAGMEEDAVLYMVGNRILPICTQNTQKWLVEVHYSKAIERIRRWRESKDDFRASYAMLDTHPVFWRRRKEEPTFTWQDSGLVLNFWHGLSDEGMMMEAGAHTDPDFTETYHDLRLDTYGTSYEDCIIQTAALVDKFFHEDGTKREGVEYEKSELELILEERLREAEEMGLFSDED